ncbi:MAG: hypothetical protein JOZ43_02715, partial [Acidobacteriales bacterium]|nr:hypothetical protein [Terriglobales bacterium]
MKRILPLFVLLALGNLLAQQQEQPSSGSIYTPLSGIQRQNTSKTSEGVLTSQFSVSQVLNWNGNGAQTTYASFYG